MLVLCELFDNVSSISAVLDYLDKDRFFPPLPNGVAARPIPLDADIPDSLSSSSRCFLIRYVKLGDSADWIVGAGSGGGSYVRIWSFRRFAGRLWSGSRARLCLRPLDSSSSAGSDSGGYDAGVEGCLIGVGWEVISLGLCRCLLILLRSGDHPRMADGRFMYMSCASGGTVRLVLYFSQASCSPLGMLLYGHGGGGRAGVRRGELGAE